MGGTPPTTTLGYEVPPNARREWPGFLHRAFWFSCLGSPVVTWVPLGLFARMADKAGWPEVFVVAIPMLLYITLPLLGFGFAMAAAFKLRPRHGLPALAGFRLACGCIAWGIAGSIVGAVILGCLLGFAQ